jgi:hypothetical protein
MRKWLSVLVVLFFTSSILFAAEESDAKHKHQPLDMLLGFNAGVGGMVTGDFLNLEPGSNFLVSYDLGLTYEVYIFPWLSVNTGLFIHPEMRLAVPSSVDPNLTMSDFFAFPICLTIPISAHVNIPFVEFLYVGAGVNINIPLSSIEIPGITAAGDLKGDTFLSIPIDIGFDFMNPNKNGSRFFIRITPSFYADNAIVPVGIMWQTNMKIFGLKL